MARSYKTADVGHIETEDRDTEKSRRTSTVDAESEKGKMASGAVVITDTTVPKRAPVDAPKSKKSERVGKSKVRKQSVLGTVIIALLLALMLVMMVQGRVEISETSAQIADLKSQLNSLEKERKDLSSKLESKLDMIAAEEFAAENGMVKSSELNQVHISTEGKEGVTIYESEDELMDGVFGTILSAISESFVRTWNTISRGE